jgi:hypothetical protein
VSRALKCVCPLNETQKNAFFDPGRTAHILLEESENLDPVLEPALGEMVAINREAQKLKARGSYSAIDVETLKQRADLIDSMRVNGVFLAPGEDKVSGGIPAGQARLVAVMEG